MSEIPRDLLGRIAARANDPMRRTHMAGALANAQPLDFTALLADLDELAPPQAKGRLGALQSLLGGKMPRGTMMGPGGMASFGMPSGPQPIPPSPGEAELAEAERAIGRAFRPELRQLYAIGDGGFGPGDGLLPLAEVVQRYRGLTGAPYGPCGEGWPSNLLPLFDEKPAVSCIDLDSGEIVVWDPEDVEDDDSIEEWRRSFAVEHPSLAALMAEWLESATFDEVRAR